MQFIQVKSLGFSMHGLGHMEKEVLWIKTKSKFPSHQKKLSAIVLSWNSIVFCWFWSQVTYIRTLSTDCSEIIRLNVIVKITHNQYQMHIKCYKDQEHFARKHWTAVSRWRPCSCVQLISLQRKIKKMEE